jgi:CheY-like chemotaxis protein
MNEVILIVDDSRKDAESLESILTELGVINPIQFVHSGGEAVAYLHRDDPYSDPKRYPYPGVIFLDLKMPGMDGFAFMKWLAARGRLKDFVIFVVSGFSDLLSIRRAYELGAKSFLTKPCCADEVAELLRLFPSFWERKKGS